MRVHHLIDSPVVLSMCHVVPDCRQITETLGQDENARLEERGF